MSFRSAWAGLCALAVGACSAGGDESASPGFCHPFTSPANTPALGGGAALESVPSFGDNPGGLAMYVHAPASLRAGAPVIVALHGCTQNASAFASAGWNELADQIGFVVVYAEQSTSNDASRCFRWWDPAQTSREGGEPRSIKAMVDYARTKYGAKDAFVTGLSAGGAMTTVMLATYPDVFRAGAVMSGLPYHCASSQSDAYTCMGGSKGLTAAALKSALPPAALANPPRLAVWHGAADYLVRPQNATWLVQQWTGAHGLGDKPTATEKVGKATHDTYKDAQGVVQVESWLIDGMGHGVALDPKNGCGTAGAFLLDESLCSARKAAEFFGVAAGGSGAGAAGGGSSSGGNRHDCGG